MQKRQTSGPQDLLRIKLRRTSFRTPNTHVISYVMTSLTRHKVTVMNSLSCEKRERVCVLYREHREIKKFRLNQAKKTSGGRLRLKATKCSD